MQSHPQLPNKKREDNNDSSDKNHSHLHFTSLYSVAYAKNLLHALFRTTWKTKWDIFEIAIKH